MQEEIITKLLEDSLQKARENCETLNERSSDGGSGETILKILKHGLSKRPSAPQELDSTNVFCVEDDGDGGRMEEVENQYEVIKEPIYEEISDEPPPLPLCPPPSETDFRKNGIFYGGAFNCCKDNFNYAPLNDDSERDGGNDAGLESLECSSCLSSSTRRRSSTRHSGDSGNSLALSEGLFYFIMGSEKHTRDVGGNLQRQPQVDDDHDHEMVGEEEEDEEEDPERDLEALYEQQKAETSLGDLSSKSSQVSNVSADRSSSSSSSSGSSSSEECNIVQTNSKQSPKVAHPPPFSLSGIYSTLTNKSLSVIYLSHCYYT